MDVLFLTYCVASDIIGDHHLHRVVHCGAFHWSDMLMVEKVARQAKAGEELLIGCCNSPSPEGWTKRVTMITVPGCDMHSSRSLHYRRLIV